MNFLAHAYQKVESFLSYFSYLDVAYDPTEKPISFDIFMSIYFSSDHSVFL